MEKKANALYKEIYSSLKEDILKGRYPAGSLLPTEQELCKLFSASRSTVRKALALLSDDKLIEARQGRGTIILGRERVASGCDYLSLRRRTTVTTRLRQGRAEEISAKSTVDTVEADSETASSLAIPPGSPVYRIQILKFTGDKVMTYITSYLAPEYVPGLERHVGKITDLYKFLFDEYGIKIERVLDTLSAEMPDFVTSEAMKLPVKSPVLVSRRTAYANSIPLEYTVTRSPGNILEYIIANNIPEPYTFEH